MPLGNASQPQGRKPGLELNPKPTGKDKILSIDLCLGSGSQWTICLEMQIAYFLLTLPVSHYMNLSSSCNVPLSTESHVLTAALNTKWTLYHLSSLPGGNPSISAPLGLHTTTVASYMAWNTWISQGFHHVSGYLAASIKQRAVESQQIMFQ